jgi:hypothetical protein
VDDGAAILVYRSIPSGRQDEDRLRLRLPAPAGSPVVRRVVA